MAVGWPAISIVLILTAALLCCLPAPAGDWPRYRGVDGDGRSAENGLLGSWPETGPTQLWKAKLGAGYAGISSVDVG